MRRVLADGLRTADIFEPGTTKVSTAQMGAAVLKALACSPQVRPPGAARLTV